MNYKEEMYGELYHYGIKGQKWGIRRFQNEDGSVTEAGKKRYNASKLGSELNKSDRKLAKFTSQKEILNIKRQKLYNKEKDLAKIDEKIKTNNERLKDVKSRTNDLLNLVKEKNYSVSTMDRTRYAHTGRQIAANMVAGPFGNVAVSALDAYRAYTYSPEAGGIVKGTKYKVDRP